MAIPREIRGEDKGDGDAIFSGGKEIRI